MGKLTKNQKRKKKLNLRQKKLTAKKQTDGGVKVVHFTPNVLSLFGRLPELNEEFDCIPEIVKFYEHQVKFFGLEIDDLEYAVASMVVMYAHWYRSGSERLAFSSLKEATHFIADLPKFQYQFEICVFPELGVDAHIK